MVSRRSLCNSDEGDSEGRRREAREVSAIILIMIFYFFPFSFAFFLIDLLPSFYLPSLYPLEFKVSHKCHLWHLFITLTFCCTQFFAMIVINIMIIVINIMIIIIYIIIIVRNIMIREVIRTWNPCLGKMEAMTSSTIVLR